MLSRLQSLRTFVKYPLMDAACTLPYQTTSAALTIAQWPSAFSQQWSRGIAQPALIEEEQQQPPSLQQTECGPYTTRTGIIAVKAGMTQDYDEWGVRVPLTVLWIDECQVVQVKTSEKEGYTSLQLGCGAKRPKQLTSSLRGHFQAAGVPLKRHLAEFRVTPDALLPVGIELRASHFVAGQFVDVAGTTIGKGFQGVMKKWGFKGQPASHGNSKAHRSAGSIGQCQDPGKVFKGKKMAGRMGNERRTVMNCLLYKVDPVRNLLYVRGQVPGHKGNFVYVRDARLVQYAEQPPRPVPTLLGEPPLEVSTAVARQSDPYMYQES